MLGAVSRGFSHHFQKTDFESCLLLCYGGGSENAVPT